MGDISYLPQARDVVLLPTNYYENIYNCGNCIKIYLHMNVTSQNYLLSALKKRAQLYWKDHSKPLIVSSKN